MDKNKIIEIVKFTSSGLLAAFIFGAVTKVFWNVFQLGWNLF